MDPLGIVPDINVALTHCLNQIREGFSTEFIYFLEKHPNLGILTAKIENRILKRLKNSRNQEVYYKFYELKENLKLEKIDNLEYEKMHDAAENFFHKLRFLKVYSYNPFNELGLEDVERLAELACIKPRYEVLYFASLDRDFIDNSKAIEGKFKVKCRYPIDLLSEVKPII